MGWKSQEIRLSPKIFSQTYGTSLPRDTFLLYIPARAQKNGSRHEEYLWAQEVPANFRFYIKSLKYEVFGYYKDKQRYDNLAR